MVTLQNPRILIVRLSAIGDVIHGLPVLNALRAAFPTAHLGWVVEGRAGDLLQGHPALDQLIRVPRKWLRSPRAVFNLRRELHTAQFDVSIDLQGLTKSAVAARLSGAKVRIGFGGVDGREISAWLNNRLVTPEATHVIDRNLELLAPLGIEQPAAEFQVPENSAAGIKIAKFVRERGLARGFALINPGAGWTSKLWPPARFAAVARHLGKKRNLPSIIAWAGANERRWADEIMIGAGGHAYIAPPTTLPELASLARRAKLFVGSDTGPLHLAAVLGTPCVGLFGPMPAERNGPYGKQHIALQGLRLITASSRARRTAGPQSMEAIGVDRVCDACERILDRAAVRQNLASSA